MPSFPIPSDTPKQHAPWPGPVPRIVWPFWVPCHRVIRGSGDLAGYKWGIERKQKLIKQESGTNDVKNMVWNNRRDESRR